MALDKFHVDWDRDVEETFFEDSKERDAVPESPIKYFFNWYEIGSKGNRKEIGDRFRHLFFSSLNLPDENEWRFERPMGRDTFGAVALFTKVDEKQEQTDAFVLKVTEADSRQYVSISTKKSRLTQEAAIMAQTNDINSDVLLRLRQYKVDRKFCRYYTEYCPHGSLETLRMRYKAYNRYFPELFLWHVFHCLASAYLDFVRGPWRSLQSDDFGEIPPGQYLLHNDIKPDNIFLGANTAGENDAIFFPKIKVGDFGLSRTTNFADVNKNQARALNGGTPNWRAPEQRTHAMNDFRNYYFGQDIHPGLKALGGLGRKCHRIRPEANIWAMGAIMWSMVTLNEIEELSQKVDQVLGGQDPGARNFDGERLLKRPDPEISRRYSSQLWRLIVQCTKLKPDDRPSPTALVSQIEAAMKDCCTKANAEYERTGDTTPFSVAFAENEIDQLPDGGARFKKDRLFWYEFGDHLLWTPRHWGLLAPPDMPIHVDLGFEGLPDELAVRQRQRWNEAVDERNKRRAAAMVASFGFALPTTSSGQQATTTTTTTSAQPQTPMLPEEGLFPSSTAKRGQPSQAEASNRKKQRRR